MVHQVVLGGVLARLDFDVKQIPLPFSCSRYSANLGGTRGGNGINVCRFGDGMWHLESGNVLEAATDFRRE